MRSFRINSIQMLSGNKGNIRKGQDIAKGEAEGNNLVPRGLI